jgi:hypothetical protein
MGDIAPVEDHIGSRESANTDAQLGNQSFSWIFHSDHPTNILQYKMMPMPLIRVTLLVPELVEPSLLMFTRSQATRKASAMAPMDEAELLTVLHLAFR